MSTPDTPYPVTPGTDRETYPMGGFSETDPGHPGRVWTPLYLPAHEGHFPTLRVTKSFPTRFGSVLHGPLCWLQGGDLVSIQYDEGGHGRRVVFGQSNCFVFGSGPVPVGSTDIYPFLRYPPLPSTVSQVKSEGTFSFDQKSRNRW